MSEKTLHILLVDDDEDDYTIIRDILSSIRSTDYHLVWTSRQEDAQNRIRESRFDACLMDYRLGWIDGIRLMKEFIAAKFQAPIILLTGYGDYEIDLQSMQEGAFDYLEKGKLTPERLERSIRYAVEKWLIITKLKKSEDKVRMLSSKVIDLQEKERTRIARELHDSIGTSLSAIKYALEEKMTAIKNCGRDREEGSLDQIIRMVRGTMQETRRLSYNLRPSILDDFGLISAVQSIIKEFQEVFQMIVLEPDIKISEENIPEKLKIIIYRILQESLSNISKHSRADRVHLFLGRSSQGLEMTIQDNGCGFSTENMRFDPTQEKGMGLEGMKERVELSGGQFQCLSGQGSGTTIRAVWPLD